MVAAQWIRLRLPSCGPVFESQAQHMRFLGKFCTLYVTSLGYPALPGMIQNRY